MDSDSVTSWKAMKNWLDQSYKRLITYWSGCFWSAHRISFLISISSMICESSEREVLACQFTWYFNVIFLAV